MFFATVNFHVLSKMSGPRLAVFFSLFSIGSETHTGKLNAISTAVAGMFRSKFFIVVVVGYCIDYVEAVALDVAVFTEDVICHTAALVSLSDAGRGCSSSCQSR